MATELTYSTETLLALLRGDLHTADRLVKGYLAQVTEVIADSVNIYAGWLVQLRREQGRSAELLPLVDAAVQDKPNTPAFRAALARVHADLGQLDKARVPFELLAGDDFASVPRDMTWTASLAPLSEVCALLGDEARAATLLELLLPHAGHIVLVSGADLVLSAVDRFVAMLASTMGHYDLADAHYRTAIELEEGIQSPPFLARTRTWYAPMLLSRGSTGDGERPGELLDAAVATAEELGMAGVAAEGRSLLTQT